MIQTFIQRVSSRLGTDAVPEPRYALAGIGVLGLLAAPLVLSTYYMGLVGSICFLATFTITWDFFTGSTGYFNFAHMVIIAVAGYSSALINTEFGVPLLLSIPVAAVIACVFGTVVIAGPSLRLQGIYFAALTFILPVYAKDVVVLFSDITGGLPGYLYVSILEPAVRDLVPLSVSGPLLMYYVAVFIFLVPLVGLVVVSKSDFGAVLGAIRQDELLLSSLGKSPTRFKIGGFALIALVTGFAGAVWTHYLFALAPSIQLSLTTMIDIIIAATIGGIGTIVGPAIGMFLLQFVDYFLVFLQNDLIGQPFGINLVDFRRAFTLTVAILFFYLYPRGVYPVLRDWLSRLGRAASTEEER